MIFPLFYNRHSGFRRCHIHTQQDLVLRIFFTGEKNRLSSNNIKGLTSPEPSYLHGAEKFSRRTGVNGDFPGEKSAVICPGYRGFAADLQENYSGFAGNFRAKNIPVSTISMS